MSASRLNLLCMALGLVGALFVGDVGEAANRIEPAPAPSAVQAADANAELNERDAAMVAKIDELLANTWQEAGVEPAADAGDGEFLRRAYLDFTGVIPRTSQVREFLADQRPDKR